MVTPTQEDYLRTIYRFQEERGRQIKISELASYLNLSKSTVSERVDTLVKFKLARKSKYSPVTLTNSGNELAKNLTKKHRIIEVFLHEFLGVELDLVHNEAHKLEHAFSDEIINKLRAKIGSPATCPHGRPIPVLELT